MKHLLTALFLLLTGFTYSQKYVLIDKSMTQPITYTNSVTLEHSYKKLFAVENDKINQFITEVEKIVALLRDKKKTKPQTLEFYVGKTKFSGLKVPSSGEERLDIVLSTDCNGIKLYMHLSDSKITNAKNAFFINTWVKYIRGGLSANK
ncbi:MAG TPA: hypothetical protein VMY77_15385 [Chitinophagaceae bacterium]|nr:hypothetical protein [Chitinophagaceae bacterium]